MNKQQAAIIQANGFAFEKVLGLTPQPKATYYTRNKETGEVVAMKNLPADPYSLNHYLRKGFVLSEKELPPLAKQEVQLEEQIEKHVETINKTNRRRLK